MVCSDVSYADHVVVCCVGFVHARDDTRNGGAPYRFPEEEVLDHTRRHLSERGKVHDEFAEPVRPVGVHAGHVLMQRQLITVFESGDVRHVHKTSPVSIQS